MIRPKEWEDTHLEAHQNINAAITQFYELFDDVIRKLNSVENTYVDAERKNFASFSKINEEISWIRKEIKKLNKNIEEIKDKLNEWRKFLTVRYDGIVDTDSETIVELDPIKDEDLKWKQYLTSIAIHEAQPNQWTEEYKFPQPALVFDEYTPRIYLKAKGGEHAVLEYNFTIILTEV